MRTPDERRTDERAAAPRGDAASAGRIEIRVTELKQLFNSMDPSPFHDKDLDPVAEEFIIGWSRELPRDMPLSLLVHLDRPAGRADEQSLLQEAIYQFFRYKGTETRRRLRRMFSQGRVSLAIGLITLTLAIGASQLLGRWTTGGGIVEIARTSLSIGAWVVMWRPLEVFLYDWWPVYLDARLFDRLAAMPVRISYAGTPTSEARRDWPAPPGSESPRDGRV